jgi:hypothetical protein
VNGWKLLAELGSRSSFFQLYDVFVGALQVCRWFTRALCLSCEYHGYEASTRSFGWIRKLPLPLSAKRVCWQLQLSEYSRKGHTIVPTQTLQLELFVKVIAMTYYLPSCEYFGWIWKSLLLFYFVQDSYQLQSSKFSPRLGKKSNLKAIISKSWTSHCYLLFVFATFSLTQEVVPPVR